MNVSAERGQLSGNLKGLQPGPNLKRCKHEKKVLQIDQPQDITTTCTPSSHSPKAWSGQVNNTRLLLDSTRYNREFVHT